MSDILVFSPPAYPDSYKAVENNKLGEICGWLRDNGFGFDQRSLFVECRYLNQHRFREDFVDLEAFRFERVHEFIHGGEDEELEREASKLCELLDIDSYGTIIVPYDGDNVTSIRDPDIWIALAILSAGVENHQSVVVGGPNLPEEMEVESYPFVDYAVDGDFELPLSNIFAHEFGGEELEVEPGLRVERDGEVFRGEPYRHPMDMKPRPHWDTGIVEKMSELSVTGISILPYHFGRGCAQACSFCTYFEDQRFEYKSVDKVVQELRQLKRETGVDAVRFCDENIFNDPDHLEDLALRIQEEELDISWGGLGMIVSRDQEFFDNLAASGCKTLYHGIESASDSVLHRMRKHQTRDMIESTLEKERKAGIKPFAGLITDYVDESMDEYYETVDFVRENRHLMGAEATSLMIHPSERQALYEKPEEFDIEILEPEGDGWDSGQQVELPFRDSRGLIDRDDPVRQLKQRYLQKLADFELLFKNFGRRHPWTFLKMQARKISSKDYTDISYAYV